MMKKNLDERNSTRIGVIKNTVRAAIGLFIFGIGLYMTIQANIGVLPWDVLYIGMAGKTGMKYGTAVIIIAVTVIAIDLLMKEKIGIGTLIDAFLVGKTVDLLNWLDVIPARDNLFEGVLLMLAGLFVLGLSQAVYMSAGLCCGPKDAMMVGLGRRIKKISIGAINVGIVCSALLIGWMLDGPVGIGTLIGSVGTGMLMQLAFNLVKFDPIDVNHQDLITSVNVLVKGSTKK